MTAKNSGNFITGELLGAAAPARKLSKGEVLYRQGESATAFYYLKSGRVRVYPTPVKTEKPLFFFATLLMSS